MILCLAGTRASIFNTLRQAFLTKSVREAFIVVICKFLPTIIFGSFLSDSLSFSIHSLTLETYSFKPFGKLASAVIDLNCENQLS